MQTLVHQFNLQSSALFWRCLCEDLFARCQQTQKAKRKEAAGESSGRDPSSLSLSLAFLEIEESSAKKYRTKCQDDLEFGKEYEIDEEE